MQLSQINLQIQTSETGPRVYQLTTKCNSPCNTGLNLFTYIIPVSSTTNQPTTENASKRKWTFSIRHNTQKESKLGRTLCTTIKIFLHGRKGS